MGCILIGCDSWVYSDEWFSHPWTVPYGRTHGARDRKGAKMVESFPLVWDDLFENLGQSRRGVSGAESPMMSMTVMLCSVEVRHFRMMLDRAGSPGLLMTAHVFRGKGVLAQEVLEV